MTLFVEGNLEISIQVQVSFMDEVPNLRDSSQQIPVGINFFCIISYAKYSAADFRYVEV